MSHPNKSKGRDPYPYPWRMLLGAAIALFVFGKIFEQTDFYREHYMAGGAPRIPCCWGQDAPKPDSADSARHNARLAAFEEKWADSRKEWHRQNPPLTADDLAERVRKYRRMMGFDQREITLFQDPNLASSVADSLRSLGRAPEFHVVNAGTDSMWLQTLSKPPVIVFRPRWD